MSRGKESNVHIKHRLKIPFSGFRGKYSRWRWLFMIIFVGILLLLIIPTPRFSNPTSTVVFSSENRLLGARIPSDGQWRFPKTDSIPEKYEAALLAYEDRWFYIHPGINPVSLFTVHETHM